MSECPVCSVTLNVCKKLNDEAFCEKKLQELGKRKISEKEFVEQILKHFNQDAFIRELQVEVDKLKSKS